jgi:acetate---CoA ligase (ADP-forming)
VGELAAMGAGGAVAFASGWSEAGAADLQARLVAAAGAMPVLGPNCYGLINYLDGALLWPDQHGGRRVERGVALLSQSSNIAINLTMQARGLPLAYVACLGNAAQVGLAELASALLADDRVTALGLYVEGIADAPALAALAEAARAAGKGIVAVKSGRTEAARSAAASHTAALTGAGVVSSAFLAQAGIAEVATLAELLETLKLCHVHGPGFGRRLCSLSCSGGEAGLVADLADPLGLDFPAPDAERRAALSAMLGPLVAIANPLDYHTFIWGDLPRTTEVFTTMLAGYDAGVFVIDPPRPDRCDPSSFAPALAAIEAAQTATGKPALPVASLPESFDETLAIGLVDRGIAPLMGLETALGAIRAAQTPAGRPGWRPWPAAATRPRVLPRRGRLQGPARRRRYRRPARCHGVEADRPRRARRRADPAPGAEGPRPRAQVGGGRGAARAGDAGGSVGDGRGLRLPRRGDGDRRARRASARRAARSGLRRDTDPGFRRRDGRASGRYGDAGRAGDRRRDRSGTAPPAALAAARRLSRAVRAPT